MDDLQQLFGFHVTKREHAALRRYCDRHGILMRDFALHFLQAPLTQVVLGKDPMQLSLKRGVCPLADAIRLSHDIQQLQKQLRTQLRAAARATTKLLKDA